LTVPGVRVVVTENSPMGVRSELSRRIKRRSAPRFDAHIGVGKRAAALVEADIGLPPGSVEVIPNAVSPFEHPAPVERTGPARLVAVSRFDPVKGLDVLVRSLAVLPNGPDGPVLTVFGDGPERASLTALADELGVAERIEWAGWVDDVRSRLVDFDVFVLPSRLEGLPMSLLEAMHAGIAVVATDVGSVSEVVDDGVSGRVVAPDDPQALATAIIDLIADPERRRKIADEGRRVALERFSSGAKVAAYEAVYDRVMSGPPKRRRRRS
jgi:glycosyltransferase involved in cell wall biosynthesis